MEENHTTDTQLSKNNFLKKLRNHTQQLHTALEEHPISASLFKPTVNRADYVRYLQLMFETVSSFERDYYPILASVLDDIDQRRKTPWLEQDLITLGVPVPLSSALINASSFPRPLYYLLGKMYVLEGSTLGGAVIYRQLQPILQFSPEKGGRYFYGYGAQTGKMWKLFMEVLATIAIEKEGEQEILQGANAQFAAMKAYFDQQISTPNDYQQYR